jgi:hypothetical protein
VQGHGAFHCRLCVEFRRKARVQGE